MSADPTFNPTYQVARCGQLSTHAPHVVEHGPDQPRNCPGVSSTRLLGALWPLGIRKGDVLALLRFGINDPGSVLPRATYDVGEEFYESISHWGARAIHQLLTDAGLLLPPDAQRYEERADVYHGPDKLGIEAVRTVWQTPWAPDLSTVIREEGT